MGKDRKDRGKDWILCNVYKVNTIWGIQKGKWLYIFFAVPKVLHHTKFITKSCISSPAMYLTVPFCQYCFSCFHEILVSIVNLDYFGITQFLLSYMSGIQDYCPFIMFIMQQLKSYYQFPISPCSNSDPGHGTKFVTLPFSIL